MPTICVKVGDRRDPKWTDDASLFFNFRMRPTNSAAVLAHTHPFCLPIKSKGELLILSMSSSAPDELALDGGAPWDGLVSKAKEGLAKGKKTWSNIKDGINIVKDSGLIKHLINSDGENPMQSLKIASDNLRKKESAQGASGQGGDVSVREEEAKGSHVNASADAAPAQKGRDHDY